MLAVNTINFGQFVIKVKHIYRRRYEKTPLPEAKAAVGKKETRICPVSNFRNSVKKNRFPTQNSTKIRQSAAELWPKIDFQYGGRPKSCHRVPNLLLCTKFHQVFV